MKAKEAKKKYKSIGGNWLAISLVCILSGLVFAIWPEVVANATNYILGGIVLVVGIIYLAISLWSKEHGFLTGFGIVFSVVLIVVGIFMIAKAEFVMALIPMIVGGIIVIHGIMDLRYSIQLATVQYRLWWIALLFAIATMGLGILLVFNPFSAVKLAFRVIGIVLMADGISDLWIGFQVKRVFPREELLTDESEIIEVIAKEKK